MFFDDRKRRTAQRFRWILGVAMFGALAVPRMKAGCDEYRRTQEQAEQRAASPSQPGAGARGR